MEGTGLQEFLARKWFVQFFTKCIIFFLQDEIKRSQSPSLHVKALEIQCSACLSLCTLCTSVVQMLITSRLFSLWERLAVHRLVCCCRCTFLIHVSKSRCLQARKMSALAG